MLSRPRENAALVRRFLTDVLGDGDTDAVTEFLAAGVDDHHLVFERSRRRETVAGLGWRALASADLELHLEDVVASDDRVAGRGRVTGNASRVATGPRTDRAVLRDRLCVVLPHRGRPDRGDMVAPRRSRPRQSARCRPRGVPSTAVSRPIPTTPTMIRTTIHDRLDDDRTGTDGASGSWHHDASTTRYGLTFRGDADV